MLEEMASSEAFYFGVLMAILLWCLHMVLWVCLCPNRFLPGHQSYWIQAHMISFSLNYLLKRPILKFSHIWGYWGLGLQHVNLGGHNSAL